MTAACFAACVVAYLVIAGTVSAVVGARSGKDELSIGLGWGPAIVAAVVCSPFLIGYFTAKKLASHKPKTSAPESGLPAARVVSRPLGIARMEKR